MVYAVQVADDPAEMLERDLEEDRRLAKQAPRAPLAFAALYRRHLQAVYAYNMARTGSTQEAQDLTSETFLAALENIASFRGTASFRAWLFGIARRKQADHFRRMRPEIPIGEAEAIPLAEAPPEEAAAESIRMGQVADALRRMAPDQAHALSLRFFGGLSVREVSQVLGKSEAAVKMLVLRGTRALRERLDGISEVGR